MQGVLAKVENALNGATGVKMSVLRGELTNEVAFKFLATGTPMATGSLKCVKEWEQEGEPRRDTYFANFTAFGEAAERLTGVNKGTEVLMLTERQSRKGKDGKWYDNDLVIYFEV